MTTSPDPIANRARHAARRIMSEPLLHTVLTRPGTQTGYNAKLRDRFYPVHGENVRY